MLEVDDRIASWSVQELIDRMRRPRYRCGGGVAACVALAQAAALADLVRRAARRSLDNGLEQEMAHVFGSIAERALARADLDRAALHELLSTLRSNPASSESQPVIEHATLVPLGTADLGLELLEMLARLAPAVPAFAASDLEAARALCRSGIQAALAMARANLPLLTTPRAAELEQEIERRAATLQESTR
jgi:formiminotetrahydrofolate cyclodeaminase|uniref:Cyclodeaminase/cyclohydrolase domain-containing protein n=1 Tax=Thermomicrobium roseum TaxID=500 RepID=A0A7C1JTZ8_THERO